MHTVFDIGANTGTWSRRAKSLFREAEFYLFEPNERLVHAHDLPGKSRSIKAAVSRSSGKKQFYVYENSVYSGLNRSTEAIDLADIVDVDVVSIDDFIRYSGARVPSLIKVDVEGTEMDVLEGMTTTLGSPERMLIVCEFSSLSGELVEIDKFLSNWGFSLFSLYNGYVDPRSGLKFGDALFGRISSER